jgi:hypothetical protein
MYNTKFIYYTEDGTVTQIRATPPDDNTLFFEIDLNLVLDFVVNYKPFDNYKIDYFLNLANGKITEVEHSTNTKLPFIISQTSGYHNEITIEHTANSWIAVVRDDVKDKIEIYKTLKVFICKKDNLSCLYMPLVFDLQNNREVAFTTEIEKDLNSISLVTGKLYNSYGVKEVQ